MLFKVVWSNGDGESIICKEIDEPTEANQKAERLLERYLNKDQRKDGWISEIRTIETACMRRGGLEKPHQDLAPEKVKREG